MRFWLPIALLLAATPAHAAEPTQYLSTETGAVLPKNAVVMSGGVGVANYTGGVFQYHRGLGGVGEARGHLAFYQSPGLFGSSRATQAPGLSLGGGYKHRLGTLGPFEAAAAGYTGVHLVNRPTVPILVALPLTWGGLTLQPRAYMPDAVNLLNGSSIGLGIGLHFGAWVFELTPAYARDIGRLTYQWKTGLRFQMGETAYWDLQIGNDEFGVGVHPGHPENGMIGVAVRVGL